MPPREIKSTQIIVRMAPSLKAAAEQAAVDDHRSLSSLVEKLLTEYLRERGYLTPIPKKPGR